MDFAETTEQRMLREAVAALGKRFGHGYWVDKAKRGEKTTELWAEAGQLGYLGVNLPAEYGGGGGGITELAIVCEELAAAGAPLLLLVVSPAIAGTVIARGGTEEQKRQWLPGIADGSLKFAFAITEPDAGSNFHNLTTTARRTDDGWVLNGQKCFISGVDEADHILVVGRTETQGRLRPALFVVPPNISGLTAREIPMEICAPEKQFLLFLDDVTLPPEALVPADAAALFAGLNPERITIAASAVGTGRYALERASAYARERSVWGTPIGAHQGVSHPLAHAAIQLEQARLAVARAAWAYDTGQPDAGLAANVAKYAAAEAGALALETAIQAHGGNGMTTEYGLATLLGVARTTRLAPVSREMILNFVAQHALGLPKSY